MNACLHRDCSWIKDSVVQFNPEKNMVLTKFGKQKNNWGKWRESPEFRMGNSKLIDVGFSEHTVEGHRSLTYQLIANNVAAHFLKLKKFC
ncbi:hypothetical protein D918_01203 [Trichuris suis]|nr:hypothetical protein D918_01203 [Trichuris suis]